MLPDGFTTGGDEFLMNGAVVVALGDKGMLFSHHSCILLQLGVKRAVDFDKLCVKIVNGRILL